MHKRDKIERTTFRDAMQSIKEQQLAMDTEYRVSTMYRGQLDCRNNRTEMVRHATIRGTVNVKQATQQRCQNYCMQRRCIYTCCLWLLVGCTEFCLTTAGFGG